MKENCIGIITLSLNQGHEGYPSQSREEAIKYFIQSKWHHHYFE